MDGFLDSRWISGFHDKFDTSSTSGYMGANYFQEVGPRFFDMSSARGYMGARSFQEFGPRCLACHVVSICIVSISSVPCRVRILHASVSMPYRGHRVLFLFESLLAWHW